MCLKTKNAKKSWRFFVTSAGFEPATNGAEIRHSIQLNYEAKPYPDTLQKRGSDKVYIILKVSLQFQKLLFLLLVLLFDLKPIP